MKCLNQMGSCKISRVNLHIENHWVSINLHPTLFYYKQCANNFASVLQYGNIPGKAYFILY